MAPICTRLYIIQYYVTVCVQSWVYFGTNITVNSFNERRAYIPHISVKERRDQLLSESPQEILPAAHVLPLGNDWSYRVLLNTSMDACAALLLIKCKVLCKYIKLLKNRIQKQLEFLTL